MKTPRLLIGSEWVDASATEPVVNPFSGAKIADVPVGDRALVERAIVVAQTAFQNVRDVAACDRAKLLHEIGRNIEARAKEFADTIIAEAGKPVVFAEAEVSRAVMTFTAAAEEARRQHGKLLSIDAFPSGTGHFGLARRFPIGVIAGITPFNFPLNLVAHKVAPCIATGNTMVVKPASKTPLTALLLAEVLVESGMPAGQVNFVTCSNEDALMLVEDARVKMVSFTGSPEVGWRLKAKCGKKRIVLELGGNAAVIVHEDADLDAAIPMIASGGFGYAGQSCISVQRVAVHAARYEEFRERFLAHVAEKIHVGDPTNRSTVIGPMINREAQERVLGWIREAESAGATLLHGGRVVGPCIEPTIFENADTKLAICAQEVFAPLVTLHRYGQFDDAIDFVNDSDFGLQAGVFTRSLPLAMRAFERLDAGGVLINQVPTFRVENMPYGGVKDSGFGREGIRYAMEEMTELKSLIIRT